MTTSVEKINVPGGSVRCTVIYCETCHKYVLVNFVMFAGKCYTISELISLIKKFGPEYIEEYKCGPLNQSPRQAVKMRQFFRLLLVMKCDKHKDHHIRLLHYNTIMPKNAILQKVTDSDIEAFLRLRPDLEWMYTDRDSILKLQEFGSDKKQTKPVITGPAVVKQISPVATI